MLLTDDDRKRAAIGAGVLVGTAEVAVAVWLAAQSEPRLFLSPMEVAADAAVVFVCVWGLTRHSRTAIIVLSVLLFLSVVQSSALSWRWWLPVVPGAFLLLALQAIPPIWRLQSGQKPPRSPLLNAVGATVGLAAVAAIVWFARELVLMPPTRVLPASQLPSLYFDRLGELGALGDPREEMLYFYSPALGPFDSEFYALTDAHVVAYSTSWTDPLIRIAYSDIVDVKAYYSGTWVEDSVVYVVSESGLEIAIPVSSEAGGDSRFASELKRQWVKNGGSLAGRKRE